MRAPLRNDGGEALASASVTSQLAVVFLVIAFGATVYLWRARYIRRRSAYVTMGVLGFAILFLGLMMYRGSI